MKKTVDRPLGEILHIVNDEGITQPDESFVAPGSEVVTLENKVIGKLGLPFGRVDKPYQPIKLKNPDDSSLVGKLVVAKIKK